ncbi:MAG: hypothetical protein ACRDTX_26110 [Pseudonocardiaceae bacterium]
MERDRAAQLLADRLRLARHPPFAADGCANLDPDVGIAGITITKDREQVLDFSYPMFSAGLEVLTIPRGSS